VRRPLDLTYDDILRLPSTSVTRFIECAGIGRVFFAEYQEKMPKGRPWRLGAYGVGEWTGVPLREVLERAGLKPTAVDVMPTGLDAAKVERPMPVAKALEPDTLLAYAMNGDLLPPDHGFPLRVVVPGWMGVNSIKWVGRISVSEEPIWVERNTKEYVLAGPDYPPQPPALGPILTTCSVKSAVFLPWPAMLPIGQHLIRGMAWSGHGAIAKVEYSLDEGRTWAQAALREPNIPKAGCRWEFPWDVQPGEHSITVRATDTAGHTQPSSETVKWNDLGYDFSAAAPHPVTVT
jgi:DMSO/TMAO reductase YedYZ molybdopterin-dependent catalytic subunit